MKISPIWNKEMFQLLFKLIHRENSPRSAVTCVPMIHFNSVDLVAFLSTCKVLAKNLNLDGEVMTILTDWTNKKALENPDLTINYNNGKRLQWS